MLKILRGLTIASLTVLMAACSSTPGKEQDAAGVEDRMATPAQTQKPITVKEQPIRPARVEPPTPLTGPAALRDPNNILSKRIIYFDYDSNLVKEQYRPLVTAHARYISQDSHAKMIIQGNTDERGSREYNLALGQRRADAVKQMMTVLGADAQRVETVSFGEEKPRAQGSSEAAYSENRRAEIVYRGE